jgi:hypothetical protein
MEMTGATAQLELPSKGLVYPKENPLSEGKVTIRYMTGKEELILLNPDTANDRTNFDKLIKAVTVSPNFEPLDLIEADKTYIIVALRIMSVGTDYPLEYLSCQHCRKKSVNQILSLENIKEDRGVIPPDVEHENSYEVKLPFSKKSIYIRHLNGHDAVYISSRLKDIDDTAKQIETMIKLTRATVLVDSETVGKDLGAKIRFVESMHFRDLREYVNKSNEIMGITEPKIEWTCPRCKAKSDVTVEVDEKFFFLRP